MYIVRKNLFWESIETLINGLNDKGGFMSEKSGGFLLLQFLQTYTPKNYPKLLHPVQGIDKILLEFNIF